MPCLPRVPTIASCPRSGSFARVVTAAALSLATFGASADCLPAAGQSKAALLALKAQHWELSAAQSANTLAPALLACLADPNPVLRDEIAFDAIQTWMRTNKLDAATVQAIRTRLLPELAAPDPQGFRQPFAALVLAEVARVDRLKAILSPAERDELVQRATEYLKGVRDYRGYDEREGWRHGVAHGADLVLQLSLNPLLQRAQVLMLLSGVASQVVPPGDHAYHYGESDRLAAPVYYIARNGWLTADDWERWLMSLATRLPKGEAQTQASLAARHNLSAFIASLYVSVREAKEPRAELSLLPGLRLVMKTTG